MNYPGRLLRILLPLLLLAACARPDARNTMSVISPACPPPPGLVLQENGMLRYYHCVSGLSPANRAIEYLAVNRHFDHHPNGADRVKLALLLSFPDTAFHDTASALRLLAPPAHSNASVPDDLRDLADMLSLTLRQQQAAEQRMHGLEKDLAAAKLHADALQVKINSVKNLERTMTQRDAP